MSLSVKAEKKELREQVSNKWRALQKNTTKRFAKIAVEQISLLDQFSSARTILIYAAQASREVDFIFLLMQQYPQKKYAFPRVKQDKMEFFVVDNYQDLTVGRFGILTPDTNSKRVAKVADLIFVPAVACDLNYNRLGRGRGYYDKFLSTQKTIFKICVLPDFAVLDKIPVESFDQKVDLVISIKDNVQ